MQDSFLQVRKNRPFNVCTSLLNFHGTIPGFTDKLNESLKFHRIKFTSPDRHTTCNSQITDYWHKQCRYVFTASAPAIWTQIRTYRMSESNVILYESRAYSNTRILIPDKALSRQTVWVSSDNIGCEQSAFKWELSGKLVLIERPNPYP